MRGFTLIELIVVIVILGILSATALPRFVNMRDEAQIAATAAVAGALTSASAINYSARKINASNGIPITLCSQAGSLLAGGLPSAQYSLGTLPIPIDADKTINCTLYGPPDSSGTITQGIASITGIL